MPGEAHLDDVADGFQILGIEHQRLAQDEMEGIIGNDSISAACASTAVP